MTRKTFTSEETAILRTSPAVIRTTSRRITYENSSPCLSPKPATTARRSPSR